MNALTLIRATVEPVRHEEVDVVKMYQRAGLIPVKPTSDFDGRKQYVGLRTVDSTDSYGVVITLYPSAPMNMGVEVGRRGREHSGAEFALKALPWIKALLAAMQANDIHRIDAEMLALGFPANQRKEIVTKFKQRPSLAAAIRKAFQ